MGSAGVMAKSPKEPTIEDGFVWVGTYHFDAWDTDDVCIATSREKAESLCKDHASERDGQADPPSFKRSNSLKPAWVWRSGGRQQSDYYTVVAVKLDV